MNSNENKGDTFLVMWDLYGLETLINVSENERQAMIAILKDDEPIRHRNPIQAMILRAQFNAQRDYEIYFFNSEISEEDIREMFEEDPQTIVDAIRRIGEKLYGKTSSRKQVIT
jgi:hypothetical protein